jgi:uncharacterized protein (TIGR03000 family)
MSQHTLSVGRLALASAACMAFTLSAGGQSTRAPAPITFEVLLPTGASLWVDSYQTTSTGERRRYQTPPLAPGKEYRYTLKATHGGKELVRPITIRHGAVVVFDLRTGYVAKGGKPAGGKPAGGKPAGAGVATLKTPKATLARRPAGAMDWQLPAEGAALQPGDLCIGLPNAALDSSNGAVRLHLRANFDEASPLPSIESAVVLRKPEGFDLQFTLDRGRIVLVNQRKDGPSKVRVHFADRYWDLTLRDPDSIVGMELASAFLPGQQFNPDPKAKEDPVAMATLLVLRGHVDRECPICKHGLCAPPGPAMIQWDSVGGQDEKPTDLETIPKWAQPKELDAVRSARIAAFHEKLQSKPLREVLQEGLDSDNPAMRRGAVYVAAALDQLDLLAEALNSAKHPDLWEHAVLAGRHWISRAPGYDRKLYDLIVKRGKLNKAEAATVVQLLHTFSDEELQQPETYELLIEQLRNQKYPIRALANWHLQRLVPEGRKIAYDPAGSPESRAKGYKAWKALIPSGKLPPGPAPEKPRG